MSETVDLSADLFAAIDWAEAEEMALHERGACHLSEWSCSHCQKAGAS